MKTTSKNIFKTVMLLVAVVAMSIAFVSCSKDDNDDNTSGGQTGKPAKYTIMFYGCGGGNVDSQLDGAIKEIVKALNVSNNQVRFTVMYNMSKDAKAYEKAGYTQDNFYGLFGNCYRYELTPQTDLTDEGYRSKYFYKKATEVQLYKQSTIVEYINWAKQTAPAENYIFMPVNHGGGFDLDHEKLTRAICYDDNNGDKGVATNTIAEALKETGTHLKAIYWYGCLMGQLEILTETAPYCDYQFTSSHVARVNADHIVSLIKGINDSPNDFEQAALKQRQYLETSFLTAFQNVADNADKTITHNENCDFGCWRSDKMADINAQVKKMGELIVSNFKNGQKDEIAKATNGVYIYEKATPHVDVLDYADNLALELKDEQGKATAKTIADDMSKAIQAANVYRINGQHLKDANGNPISTKRRTFSLGISIYSMLHDFPYQMYSANYKASAFDKATNWSAWFDQNEISILITDGGLLNPMNDSSWELYWLED